jgi:hypothetical protein
MLIIPLYIFTLSPTCGAFGPSIPKSNLLSGLTFAAVIPGIAFSLVGVLGRSNAATGISGAVMTFIIIANTSVEPYFTVIDFIMVLFFLEITTTLTTFSEIADSTITGVDETVSYNYRLVAREYMRRLVAITLVTLLGSVGALFIITLLAIQIGTSGLAVLTTFSLLLVMIVIVADFSRH